jgi:head-tail adaptor
MIGTMRHRIDIYTITTTADGEGGTTAAYTLTYQKYAEVLQMSMNEVLRSGQVVGEAHYKIRIRKGVGETFNRSMQIRWNSEVMNITSSVSDEFWHYIVASTKQ